MEKSASLFNTAQNGTRSRILVLRGKNDLSEPIRFLSDHYDVVGVNNFDEALAELRQHRFQLVISEVSDFLPLERAAVAEQAAVILETIGQGVGIMELSGKLIWGTLLLHSLPDGVLDSL